MSTPTFFLKGVLDQIHHQGKIASSSLFHPASSNGSLNDDTKTSFSDMLINSLNGISQIQTTAKENAENYLSGKSQQDLSSVMLSIQKSSLALNFGIQVRNKMVSAYQDI
ncbi:TPA: flagellar hook-basal body complex protein FliE, partial [Salmonella enterica]